MRPRTLRAVVLGQLAAVGEMLKRGWGGGGGGASPARPSGPPPPPPPPRVAGISRR